MKLEEDRTLRHILLERVRQEYHIAQEREGLHLSSLIYCLTKHWWDKTDPLPATDEEVELWSIGYGLERVFIEGLHIEEMELDGIRANADFALLDELGDLKSTRMSPAGRKGEGGFRIPSGWERQFKGYRYMKNVLTGERLLDFAIAVIHLIQPKFVGLRAHFTEQELEDNWSWIVDRSNLWENMIATNDPMVFQTNDPYECEKCRYALRCQLQASLDRIGRRT